MSAVKFPHGFRIRGSVFNPRKRVVAAAAFDAYRLCDPRAEIHEESYLSAFQFADDFAAHLATTRSPGGFAGGTWSPYLWWDIDRGEPGGRRRQKGNRRNEQRGTDEGAQFHRVAGPFGQGVPGASIGTHG